MKIRRPSTPFLVSLAIHALVVAFFVQALVMSHPLFDVFGRRTTPVGPVERIGFLQLPAAGHQPPTPGQRGGNGRPITHQAPPPPVTAPPSVPLTLPSAPAPSKYPENPEPATGPLVGGGGNLRGVQPRYGDPRLWGEPGKVATAPKTSAQQLDSVIAGDIAQITDSAARVAAANPRKPGDWTIERGGKKYGVDSKYIRLGPIAIPTAVLAMLPINITNNPSVSQRERAYNAMHDDIMSHAQTAMNEADFQKAVRSIRQRKERERQEKEKQKAAEKPQAASQDGSSTPAPSPAPANP